MIEDSVLRCLIAVKHGGQVEEMVLDAVREEENYLIVLEWGTSDDDQHGVTPRQYVEIPSSEIEIETDSSKDYEIVSNTGIDLDAASVTDVEGRPKKLFQSPPRN